MKKAIVLCILTFILGLSIGFFVNREPADMTDVVLQATIIPEQQTALLEDGLPAAGNSSAQPTHDLTKNTALLAVACDAAEYIKEKNYAALSEMIHPVDGVIFVPYSTVNLAANLRFTSSQIASLATDKAKYVWGITDGKGDPIEMTMSQYFDIYVFNTDYTAAPMIGVNSIMQYGNSLENVEEIFPQAQYVEFHFSGLEDKNQGCDWCTLRLVFEKYNDQYKIIAVIHSQWTI